MFLARLASFVALSTLFSPLVLATTITSDASTVANQSFDFVIAGGGLTGIVVANKLSAEGYDVLLIEAGKSLPDHPAIYDIERRGELNNDPATNCNWQYTASAVDGSDLPIKVDSGRCLGGSSSINGAVWFRPAATEMDAIRDLGNPGWDYNSLRPYFDAAEGNILPTNEQRALGADVSPAFHGYNGPVRTSFPTPMRIPMAVATYKAAMTSVFGLTPSADLSDRYGPVLSSTSWSIYYDEQEGINRRSSSAYAYLYPASQQQSTLTVLTEHTVGKVLLNHHLRAVGVEFGPTGGGTLYTASASREVLLAGGALGTPPILERSGIGERNFIEHMGITHRVHLPGVGLNLQDQPGIGLSGLVDSQFMSNTSFIDNRNIFAPVIGLSDMDQLFGNRANQVIHDLNDHSKLWRRINNAVDARVMASTNSALKIFTAAINLMVNSKMPVAEVIGESYPAVMVAAMWPSTPLSRGHVHARSSNPFDPPRITPRFLTDEFDIDVAVTVAKNSRAMFTSPAFSSIVVDPAADGPPAGATDAEWEAWYKANSFGASHWTGSCSMLPLNDGGVVDSDLKVYGTHGLRVIDASILPLQITSHTQPVAYAIALKAADLILADC